MEKTKILSLQLLLWLMPWTLLSAQHVVNLSRHGIKAGEYSGITSLGEGLYGVVSDDTPMGFIVWRIEVDSVKGRIREVSEVSRHILEGSEVRDQEDLAYDALNGWVWICGEDQRIIPHSLDGQVAGQELDVPTAFDRDHIQPNRGFEALCYNPYSHQLIATTESPLKGSEPDSILPLLYFSPEGPLLAQQHYRLGPPQAKKTRRGHYHGVVAMTMLDEHSLLVLEREAYIARRYLGSKCWHRLVALDLVTQEKRVLREWSTRFRFGHARMANYEGMCLGPRLQDGRPTLLLVSDSESRKGRGPWHLKDYLMLLPLDQGED